MSFKKPPSEEPSEPIETAEQDAIDTLNIRPKKKEADVEQEQEIEPTETQDDGRPSSASSNGERLRRYQEQHICIDCSHIDVCEVGRHSAELFREGWHIVIGDCSHFEGQGE